MTQNLESHRILEVLKKKVIMFAWKTAVMEVEDPAYKVWLETSLHSLSTSIILSINLYICQVLYEVLVIGY